jgi:hypothetical protein
MTVPIQGPVVHSGTLQTQCAWTDVTGLQVKGSVHAGGASTVGVSVGEPAIVPPPKSSRVVIPGPKAANPMYPPWAWKFQSLTLRIPISEPFL